MFTIEMTVDSQSEERIVITVSFIHHTSMFHLLFVKFINPKTTISLLNLKPTCTAYTSNQHQFINWPVLRNVDCPIKLDCCQSCPKHPLLYHSGSSSPGLLTQDLLDHHWFTSDTKMHTHKNSTSKRIHNQFVNKPTHNNFLVPACNISLLFLCFV